MLTYINSILKMTFIIYISEDIIQSLEWAPFKEVTDKVFTS
jgi:hypothetical protein